MYHSFVLRWRYILPLIVGLGPCLGLCLLSGSSLFMNTLSCLSTAGCVSAQLVVLSEASQHWSLQAIGWGQVLVKMATQLVNSQQTSHSVLLSQWANCPLCLQGTLGNSDLVSYELIALFPRSWWVWDPVCNPPTEYSFCFSVLQFMMLPLSSARSLETPLSARPSNEDQHEFRPPSWKNFFSILIFSCESSTWYDKIWFYQDCTPPYHLFVASLSLDVVVIRKRAAFLQEFFKDEAHFLSAQCVTLKMCIYAKWVIFCHRKLYGICQNPSCSEDTMFLRLNSEPYDQGCRVEKSCLKVITLWFAFLCPKFCPRRTSAEC